MSTVFTKIINGELPAHKIYENDHVFVFLDNNPMQRGHTLVVPKKEVEYLFDLDDETYVELMKAVKEIAILLKTKLNCTRVCELVEGYAVPHAHVHLIPTNSKDDFDKKFVHPGTKEELDEVQAVLLS